MFKRVLAVLSLLVVAGCDRPPLESRVSSNPLYQVDKLFSHDGCTIYRFRDGLHNIYYAVCQDGKVQTSWNQSAGKTSYPTGVTTRIIK